MEKLSKLLEKNPKLKSNKSEYLKLAVKEGKAVKGTGPHKVKLVGCENATNKDYMTQQMVKGVNLLFEEDGEPKKYFVPTIGKDGKFHYLIERFAEIEEGTELILEYVRKEGSVAGFIDVRFVGEGSEISIKDEEIPVINIENEDESSEENLGTELDS